jgi:hypothetical protein
MPGLLLLHALAAASGRANLRTVRNRRRNLHVRIVFARRRRSFR